MRSIMRAGIWAGVSICLLGGIVYAALDGADFEWLSVSQNGIRIGEAASEGENVPAANTLEFANEDSYIVFSGENSVIDFNNSQGSIGEYEAQTGSNPKPERLQIWHAHDMDFEAGNSMLITSGDKVLVNADDTLMLSVSEYYSRAGGLFLSTQESPTIDITTDVASLIAANGTAGISALQPDGEGVITTACINADTQKGLIGETFHKTLRLTVFNDEDPEGESVREKISELCLYQPPEGEEEADYDARLISYRGDACLQTAVYDPLEDTATITAEVRVCANGNIVVQLTDD